MNIQIFIKDQLLRGVLFVTLLGSCSIGYSQQDPTQQLLGSWQLEETASFASMDTQMRVRLDSLPQLHAQLLTAYRGRSTYFGSDGSYTVSLADGRSVTGRWQLTPAGELELTDPAGNKSYQKIIGLDPTRLVLEPMNAGDFRSILKELHFIKR